MADDLELKISFNLIDLHSFAGPKQALERMGHVDEIVNDPEYVLLSHIALANSYWFYIWQNFFF